MLDVKDGTDGNDTDNDVFRSGSESPQYTLPITVDPKQRRATVSGGSPTLERPSLVIEDLDPPTRPKSEAINAAERTSALAALTDTDSGLENLAGHRKLARMRSSELSKTKISLTVPDQFQRPEVLLGDDELLEDTAIVEDFDKTPTPTMDTDVFTSESEKGTPKHQEFRVTRPTPIILNVPEPPSHRLSKHKVLDCELAYDMPSKDQPQLMKIKKLDSLTQSDVENRNYEENEDDKKTESSKHVEFSADTKDGDKAQEAISYTHIVVGGVIQKIPNEQLSSTESPGAVRRRNKPPGKRLADRRISCKDLGKGDCEGWLYKRKTKDRGPLTKHWVKRWCILKLNNLYYYKEKNDLKAEGVIHLLAFQVSPATDIKTKKFAFKVHNAGTTFYFGSERQEDMSKWMNKMGLAAINFDTSNIMTTGGFIKPETTVRAQGYGIQNMYYSESDDDNDDLDSTSTMSDSCMSLASTTSKDSVATLTPSSQNSPEKQNARADEEIDDLVVMMRNIQKSDLTIDGIDRNKTRRSQITSARLINASSAPEVQKRCKLKLLQRTLKAKENELENIDQLFKEPVTPSKLHQFQDQHKELLTRRRSRKDKQ